jgi:predicted kinase
LLCFAKVTYYGQFLIASEQIKPLSTAEKLQVMETLWQELTAESADQLASPAWHQQALQQTEHAVREGDEVTHDWEQAKQSMRNKFR